MDIGNRTTTSHLISYVGRRKSTSFFQLVENLSSYHKFDLTKIDEINLNENIFVFRTNPSIGFPASDINSIQIVQDNRTNQYIQYQIETNFFGLNGSTSPLPSSYLDTIASEYAFGTGIKHQYFDFFNHRLIILLIKSWRKYKYYINYKDGIDDVFSKRLFAFIGVGNYARTSDKLPDLSVSKSEHVNDLEDIDWHKLLYFMGVLLSRVRSPQMIASIIMHYFNLTTVRVLEWQKQQVKITDDQKNKLGQQNMCLSDNFIIGENVTSYSKKYALVLDNLTLDNFYDFLPNGKRNLILRKLMTFLMKDLLPYDIHLGINLDTVPDFILGNEQHSLLGWTTFMNVDKQKTVASSQVTIVGQS
ncbi:type VI secretion system baseplate subunit TssG [Pasteurella atlantica]|uniref:Type VI secretion system baseplate subunit TssG n=2 Tax=Pasteurellaceae TaxID=712 RepID=A0ACC6HPB8_9PAST|nr:type VI secretion system baseplate subunit TssG [Pasteurella atlantica]MDP8052624.1 type VI secretion system baseplate subunit TssG [Pasteurella atlantica]MDP8105776.1 type VI secretion system baseplate subunit TssG [Pasteurella atlantica]MDP8149282.1 type VI secretion system baseplate subunit TssG [Pasteurella atlantica]